MLCACACQSDPVRPPKQYQSIASSAWPLILQSRPLMAFWNSLKGLIASWPTGAWAWTQTQLSDQQVVKVLSALKSLNKLCGAVWWMRVWIDSQLSSILAFATESKKNSNSTQFVLGFWSRYNPWPGQSGGRVQVWVQVWAPAGHLAITSKGYFRR